MAKEYGIGRKRAAIAMARAATSAEARLIHHGPAGRDGAKAISILPFLLPRKGPATQGERAVLHLPASPPGPRGKPGGPAGERR